MQKPPRRFADIADALVADQGTAVLLKIIDTERGVHRLEIERHALPKLIAYLMKCSYAMANVRPVPPGAPGENPASTVRLQASDANATNDAQGNRSLVLRTGVVDLEIPLGDAVVRAHLLRALTMTG